MTVLKPRSRTISVRLSEEEFAALERFCAAGEARSISDLARNAICDVLKRSGQQDTLADTVHEYAAQVRNLEHSVKLLTEEMASIKSDGQLLAQSSGKKEPEPPRDAAEKDKSPD
jgi:Arc/MetJ-type ribon-helix-helix transcriptional regulator